MELVTVFLILRILILIVALGAGLIFLATRLVGLTTSVIQLMRTWKSWGSMRGSDFLGRSNCALDRATLLHYLVRRFNLEELRVLVFEMQIDWELLAGNTMTGKSISLIEYADRHELIDDLLEKVQRSRPRTNI